MNKGRLPTLNHLPPAGVFFVWACLHGLVPLGQVVCILQNSHNTCLPWVFIPHGLLLVNSLGFFHRYLQWAFRKLVVLFEIIGQVSNTFVNNTYYDEFHIANNVHGF